MFSSRSFQHTLLYCRPGMCIYNSGVALSNMHLHCFSSQTRLQTLLGSIYVFSDGLNVLTFLQTASFSFSWLLVMDFITVIVIAALMEKWFPVNGAFSVAFLPHRSSSISWRLIQHLLGPNICTTPRKLHYVWKVPCLFRQPYMFASIIKTS